MEHVAHAMGDKREDHRGRKQVMEHVTHAMGDKKRERYRKRPGTK